MSKQTHGQQVFDLDVELALTSKSDLAAAMRRSSPFEARYVRVLKRESTVPGLSGRNALRASKLARFTSLQRQTVKVCASGGVHEIQLRCF